MYTAVWYYVLIQILFLFLSLSLPLSLSLYPEMEQYGNHRWPVFFDWGSERGERGAIRI
jgi:hypothetical protein